MGVAGWRLAHMKKTLRVRAAVVAVYLSGGGRNRLADHDRNHALQGLASVRGRSEGTSPVETVSRGWNSPSSRRYLSRPACGWPCSPSDLSPKRRESAAGLKIPCPPGSAFRRRLRFWRSRNLKCSKAGHRCARRKEVVAASARIAMLRIQPVVGERMRTLGINARLTTAG